MKAKFENPDLFQATPGVVSFVSASDIPGVNSVWGDLERQPKPKSRNEEIFCSGHVYYAGQAIGVIVAESYELARKAAE